MFGPYHYENHSADVIRKIVASGELWGKPPRNCFQSEFPKSKAYRGPLPPGKQGVEFETDIPPDKGHVPDKPTWSARGRRRGVELDGDYAKIKVHVLRYTIL